MQVNLSRAWFLKYGLSGNRPYHGELLRQRHVRTEGQYHGGGPAGIGPEGPMSQEVFQRLQFGILMLLSQGRSYPLYLHTLASAVRLLLRVRVQLIGHL